MASLVRRRQIAGSPRRLLVALVAALLAVGLAVSGSIPVAADDDKKNDVERRLNDASDALEDANEAVRQATQALQEAQAQLPAAQKKLDEELSKEAAARQAFEQATAAYEQAEAEYAAATERLAAIESEYEGLRSNVGDFARRAYQMGPFAEIEMVLNASDPVEFTDRLEAIRSVAKANNAALQEVAANRANQSYTEMRMDALAQLAKEQKELAQAKLAEAEAARAAAEAAKKVIDDLIAQRDAALAIAESQKASVEGQYAALQAEQVRIAREAQAAADLAAELARQAAATGGGGWSSADGFTWPITGGGITQLTGPRVHPVYGYRSCHTGMDIRGGMGTPIHAVQAGVVAVINNGGPYGMHTIIAHGDGVASFYAHQSRTNVSIGQQVAAGDVIGFVGSTGWVTGPHLHFEIHVSGVPFNPLGWYGQAKTPVRC